LILTHIQIPATIALVSKLEREKQAKRMVHVQTYIQRISLRFGRLPVVIVIVLL
jgi:hypothetical protein